MVTITDDCVEFRFYRPHASRVWIAGDFNEWKTGEVAMKHLGDGNWFARLELPQGEYRFRYCADGEWYADYAASGLEPGRFGMDSVVIVPARPLKVPAVSLTSAKAEKKDTQVQVA
jgi:1,4-alpha-glucan branching enzyme